VEECFLLIHRFLSLLRSSIYKNEKKSIERPTTVGHIIKLERYRED